ncbi:MAG: coenzyme F420 hydrogenase [Candidatus Cloacimonas sp. 4484_209]|nr:MAG: coenzyme F420 hydrogenase [Candidatus Cloacimonas sp. 4484_209]
MSKVLEMDKGVEEGIQELLRFLLENGKVKGVFTLKKERENGVAYSLITEPNVLKDALPFYPLMPQNMGKLLSQLTWIGPINKPIAVVIRPCELRAFVELVKRKQSYLENFLFISSTCGGVYPLKMAVNGELNKKIPQYWEIIKKGENVSDIRPACKGCVHFLPYTADITVALIGEKDMDNKCKLFLNTEKGKKFVEGVEGEFIEGKIETKEVKDLESKRVEEKKKLFEDVKIEEFGMKGLIETFGRCIGCHGCSKVCPICFCGLCFFDSQVNEYMPHTYETELEKRDGLRVPPDTVFFHIGRLTHMGVSCVGCGMCEDVCPVDIPISTIFSKVGESIQDMFDYLPGRNVEEKVPITVFEEKEFAEVEK